MTAESVRIPRRRCLQCDAHVTRDFARVYGDSNDRAHRCLECDSVSRLSRGSGAGVDPGIPDPQDHPGRWGNRPVIDGEVVR